MTRIIHGHKDTEDAIFVYPTELVSAGDNFDVVETIEGVRFDFFSPGVVMPTRRWEIGANEAQAVGWFLVARFMVDEPQVLLEKLRRGLRDAGISTKSELYGIIDELEQGLKKP